MGARGPKPESTASKKRRGNPGKRPMNDREPQVESGQFLPEPWFTAEQLTEWNRVEPLLREAGITTLVDRSLLVSYCEAYGRYVHGCATLVQAGGPVLTSKKTGVDYLNPHLNAMSMADKQWRACAAQLGVGAASRSGIKVAPPVKRDKKGKGKFFNPELRVVG